MAAKDVTITLTIDCPGMYSHFANGSLQEDSWDNYLTWSDDNSGSSSGHVETFETHVYAGRVVTIKAETKSGNSSSYKVSIDKLEYEPEFSDDNIFSSTTINGNSGKVTATVRDDAPVLPPSTTNPGGVNEDYKIYFTVSPNPANDTTPPKSWAIDPKLKVDPST